MNYHSYDATEAWEHVNPHNKEIVKFFMENLGASGRSKKTIEKYTHNLKLFFQWVLIERNNKPFYEIKKRDYSGWFNYLVNKQNLSPARVRVLRSTVSSLSNFCENILAEDDDFEEYEGFRNIVLKIEAPSLENTRVRTFLTKEQIDLLLETLLEKGDYQKALYVVLSFVTGARKAEICQLKVSDFETEHLNGHKVYYKTHPIRCKGNGLQGKQREFTVMKTPIYSFLVLWLKERERLGVLPELDDLFVANSKNGYYAVKPETFNSWCTSFTKILGVPVYPHAFRASIATHLHNAEGKDMSKIQSLLGHKSMETTQHYIEDISGLDIFDLFEGEDE